jgi:hypothetical protein
VVEVVDTIAVVIMEGRVPGPVIPVVDAVEETAVVAATEVEEEIESYFDI